MPKWEVRADMLVEAADEDAALELANKALSTAVSDGFIETWWLREVH